MNRYTEMKTQQGEAISKLPLRFAFSDKQFNEMMRQWGLDPENDLNKISYLFAGGYIQKKDIPLFKEVVNKNHAQLSKAIAEDTTGDGFIYEMFLDEMDGHEYGYTQDLTDTLNALGMTLEEICADSRLLHGLEKAAKVFGGSVMQWS